MSAMLRDCLRDPIPEIFDAARYVDAAVSAHLSGNRKLADELIRLANMPAIRVWTESLWGKGGPWRWLLPVANPIPLIPKRQRINLRMPNKVEVAALIRRDGYRCRFCGIPVVRAEIRTLMHKAYPEALPWGNTNLTQHAGFQALWMQYVNLLPHARGGDSSLDNMIVTCAPCNNGRSNLTLEEAGLTDPGLRSPITHLGRFGTLCGDSYGALGQRKPRRNQQRPRLPVQDCLSRELCSVQRENVFASREPILSCLTKKGTGRSSAGECRNIPAEC